MLPARPMREELSITIPEWTGGPSQSKITYPRQENRKDEEYEESTKKPPQTHKEE